MKTRTLEVKHCGECPFMQRGDFGESDDCGIDPGPPPRHRGRWSGIECLYSAVPKDCPLRVESVRVKAAWERAPKRRLRKAEP